MYTYNVKNVTIVIQNNNIIKTFLHDFFHFNVYVINYELLIWNSDFNYVAWYFHNNGQILSLLLFKEMQSIFIIDGDFQVSLFRPCFIYISINRYKIYTMLFVFSSDIETVLNVKILGEKMTIIWLDFVIF